MSANGTVTTYNNSGSADVIVDVEGWYKAPAVGAALLPREGDLARRLCRDVLSSRRPHGGYHRAAPCVSLKVEAERLAHTKRPLMKHEILESSRPTMENVGSRRRPRRAM